MVRSSSQIGMACAVMERPQESAIKPKHLPSGLLRNFFLRLIDSFLWQSKERAWSFTISLCMTIPQFRLKELCSIGVLCILTHKYIPLTSVMFKYVMKSFLNWGLFPFNLKVNYPKYKLLLPDVLGFMWYNCQTWRAPVPLGGSR